MLANKQHNKHHDRQIILLDQQGNKTVIIMQLLDTELSPEDIAELTTIFIKHQETITNSKKFEQAL